MAAVEQGASDEDVGDRKLPNLKGEQVYILKIASINVATEIVISLFTYSAVKLSLIAQVRLILQHIFGLYLTDNCTTVRNAI